MKRAIVLTLFAFLFLESFAQTTIWEEDFQGYPNNTTIGTGFKWISYLVGAGEFSVQGDAFEASGNMSQEGIWATETIDLSSAGGYVEIDLTIDWDLSSFIGNAEATVEVYYNLDSQGDQLLYQETNSTEFLGRDVSQSSPVSQILKGSTLVITIRARTIEEKFIWFGGANSLVTWDDITITKVPSFYAIASSDWDDKNVTWSDESYASTSQNPCDCEPGAGEIAVIGNGFDVSIDNDNGAKALILENGGSLTFSNSTSLDISSAYVEVGTGSSITTTSGESTIAYVEEFPSSFVNYGLVEVDNLEFPSSINELTIENYNQISIANGFETNTTYNFHNHSNSKFIVTSNSFPNVNLYTNYSGNTVEFAASGNFTIPTPADGNFHNLEISGTGRKRVNSLSVSGDISLVEGFLQFSNNLTLNGNGKQTLSGDIRNIRDLTINNTSGTVPAVFINSPLTIRRNLDLQNGIAQTTSANPLTIDRCDDLGSATAYIDGPVSISSERNVTLPLGKNGKWAPVELTSVTSSTQYSVEYHNQAYANTNFDATLMGVSTTEYWDINIASGEADVRLYFMDAAASGIVDVNDLTVAHWNGTDWEDMATVVGTTPISAVNFVEVDGVNSFSPFTFGSPLGINPLPVEFIDVYAQIQTDHVLVHWATATEVNNNYFIIEKSLNGTDFFEIGRMIGAGNSKTRLDYEYEDEAMTASKQYYRIKQIDFDGAFDYSKAVSVGNQLGEEFKVQAYPNPVVGDFFNLKVQNANSEQIFLSVMNMKGDIVLKKNLEAGTEQDEFRYAERLPELTQGLYTLIVRSGTQMASQKLMIQ